MMPASHNTPDPGREVLARRSFKFAGVAYERGEAFDWRAAGCTERQLQRMFAGRQLINAGEASLPRDGVVARRCITFDGRRYEAGEAFDYVSSGCSEHRFKQLMRSRKLVFSDAESVPIMADGQSPIITKTGRGWYEVQLGDRVEKVRGEEDAKEMAALMVEESCR